MASILSKFGFSSITTLLARTIEINPNPSSGEDYLFLEGDKIGFWNWLLKLLGISDPSIKISVNEKFVTKVKGGKFYETAPTSGIYGFNAGFEKDKKLLLMALLFFIFGFPLIPTIIGTILLWIIAIICLWLYSRSGAMVVSIFCYKDGFGGSFRIKSGLTGRKLEKSDFENVYNALKNASLASSTFYQK